MLDIGCGTGSLTKDIARVGFGSVLAIDTQERLIEQCKMFKDDRYGEVGKIKVDGG